MFLLFCLLPYLKKRKKIKAVSHMYALESSTSFKCYPGQIKKVPNSLYNQVKLELCHKQLQLTVELSL